MCYIMNMYTNACILRRCISMQCARVSTMFKFLCDKVVLDEWQNNCDIKKSGCLNLRSAASADMYFPFHEQLRVAHV